MSQTMLIRPLNEFDGKGWLRSKLRNPFVPVSLIVMHSTAGSTLSGAISALRSKGFGYHYLIEKDGTIWKCVPYKRSTTHAGNSYGPREQAKGVSRVQNSAQEFVAGCSVNGYSIGVSFVHENDGQKVITSAQMTAAEQLVRALADGIPSLKHVSTHAIVSPRRKTDPRPFDLEDFALAVGLIPWRF